MKLGQYLHENDINLREFCYYACISTTTLNKVLRGVPVSKKIGQAIIDCSWGAVTWDDLAILPSAPSTKYSFFNHKK